ncbi:MAG: hypothetical protein WCL04_06255, partial [Verrucomicrobiota bacterium]
LTVILRSQIPNNSQWCRDWYDAYPDGRVTDPNGPAHGPAWGSFRVTRGSDWANVAWNARSAFRGPVSPDYHGYAGFRLALSSVR